MSHIHTFILYISIGLCLLANPYSAFAQNTSGVVGATVDDGESTLEYRLGIDPDNSRGETGVAQRLHYQRSINSDLRWRVVGRFRKTQDSDFDFDYVEAELVWQLSEDDKKYQQGLRFDARLRGDSRPGQLGINWAHQWKFGEGWEARGVLKSEVQIGQGSGDDFTLESQARLQKKLPKGRALGVKMFSTYGDTSGIDSFDEQSHVAGPYVSTPFFEKVKLSTGVLFGLTETSPDTQIQFWLTRSF